MGGIDLALLFDLLDANPQAILGEDNVLLAHSFRDLTPHLGDAQINLVPDPGGGNEDGEEDDEREELTRGCAQGMSAREGGRLRRWDVIEHLSFALGAEDVKIPEKRARRRRWCFCLSPSHGD